jgi:hypothetical protein
MLLRDTGETLKIGLEHGKKALTNIVRVIKGEPELVSVNDIAILRVSSENYKDFEKLSKEISKSSNILSKQAKVFDKNKIIEQLNSFKDNKIDHIINGSKNSNHKWEKLVSDKNWNDIKKIIVEVMETGKYESYKKVDILKLK